MAVDPLSVSASLIAIAGLAWTSSKALYDVIDGLADAPQAITNINNNLVAVQAVLESLKQALGSKQSAALDPVLRQIGIDVALEGCRAVCDDFKATIDKYTTHSTKTKFSKRDRLTVTFRKSKIATFTERLDLCKSTINLALTSATLYVILANLKFSWLTHSFRVASTHILDNTSHSLQNQEEVLKTHKRQLAVVEGNVQDLTLIDTDEESDIIPITTDERNLALALIPELRKVCEEALSITTSKRTGQKFGKMTTTDRSRAGMGIVGKASLGVEQEFGDMVTQNESRAFQGQMDSASFAMLMGDSTSK